MPVSVAEIEGHVYAGGSEFVFDGSEQSAVLSVDGADATEMLIVLGNLEHPLVGDVAASEDVFEEWQNVVRAFGAAEGDEKEGVVGHRDILADELNGNSVRKCGLTWRGGAETKGAGKNHELHELHE
jgi:hypothetical protein